MPSYFCLTVRFLQPRFHGRGDGGEPEWPPSPLRAVQALVAASAACRQSTDQAEHAFRWLEALAAPTIVACSARRAATKYRLYVPDNVGDKVAATWCRGGEASIAEHRTEKDVAPQHLEGTDPAVHYLWPLGTDATEYSVHSRALARAAQSITHLGWGVDMVVGSAQVMSEEQTESLPGVRWLPDPTGTANCLRIPVPGTTAALHHRHAAFLQRLSADGGFFPVPPLSMFSVNNYRHELEPPRRSVAAFEFIKCDGSGKRRAFDHVRELRAVVGMLRNATRHAAEMAGWSAEKTAAFVLGHAEARGERHQPVSTTRFAYLPLPSLEFRKQRQWTVGMVRRAMITTLDAAGARELEWIKRALAGQELIRERPQEPVAMLSLIPDSDPALAKYCGRRTASTWATVTPMILPGYDDKHRSKADALIRKAMLQANISPSLAAHAELDWRPSGFWPGVDLAAHYQTPDYLRSYPRFHVRITWRDANGNKLPIGGPLCLGGGRFVGLGLFAAFAE